MFFIDNESLRWVKNIFVYLSRVSPSSEQRVLLYIRNGKYGVYRMAGERVLPVLVRPDPQTSIVVVDKEGFEEVDFSLENHFMFETYAGTQIYFPDKLKKDCAQENYLPLFSHSEQKKLFSVIREEVILEIAGKPKKDRVPEFPYMKKELRADLAVWVKGELRGSIIVNAENIDDFISKSAKLIAHDMRFKPLESHELSLAFFEVTFMSPFLIPIEKNRISDSYFSKDHGILGMTKTKSGFFIPSVYKVLNFTSFGEVLSVLQQQKMGEKSDSESSFFSFRTKVCSEDNPSEFTSSDKSFDSLWGGLIRYLSFNCDCDGFLPFYIDLVRGEERKVDWARLLYAGSVFSYLVSQNVSENNIVDISSKLNIYVKKVIPHIHDGYSLLYASLMFFYDKNLELANEIFDRYEKTERVRGVHEDLLYLRVVLALRGASKQLRKKILNYGEEYLSMLDENKNFQLVEFADIPLLLSELAKIDNNPSEEEGLKKEIIKKVLSLQLPHGPFPVSTGVVGKPYVRASSKIFESMILASSDENVREGCLRYLSFVQSLQITETNSFFVKESLRNRVYGGIMHDEIDTSILLDSVVHTLMVIFVLKQKTTLHK